MGQFITQLNHHLWKMHRKTKSTLTFFSFGAAAEKKSNTSEQEASSNISKPPKKSKGQIVGLILGPLLFFATLLFFSPEGMPKEAQAVLASTLWVATWWITEAMPIPVTSLLPIVLFPLSGGLTTGVTSAYADNTIFLFLGGFVVALALEKWNLHRRIALNILMLVGTSTQRIILGFMVATGFLSMWISNTATAMMMMPIALSIITHVNDSLKQEKKNPDKNFGKAAMLAVAYSASIGGLATLIGTPPNTIFAGVVKELYGIDISFAQWMLFGVPITILLMAVAWFYLVKIAFPLKMKEIPGGKDVIQKQKQELGRMSYEEKIISVVFVGTALAWITRTFILNRFIPIDDTMIAILAAVILFLLPAKNAKDGRLLNWLDSKNIDWGVLLLFGGGLAIAKGFKETGLAQWIGEQLTVLQGVHLIIIVGAVATLVLFLTEITSNTATATMMFPIMAALALSLDVHPYALMVAAGVSASCAFMLPVATPPNAVVFGSGLIKITDMAKAGFWINIFCIFIITLFAYYYLPIAWGIEINVYPEALK